MMLLKLQGNQSETGIHLQGSLLVFSVIVSIKLTLLGMNSAQDVVTTLLLNVRNSSVRPILCSSNSLIVLFPMALRSSITCDKPVRSAMYYLQCSLPFQGPYFFVFM